MWGAALLMLVVALLPGGAGASRQALARLPQPPAAATSVAPQPPEVGCIVPAADLLEPGCFSLLDPGRREERTACNLPIVYLGGTPGPCPERKGPPQSRVIPVLPDAYSLSPE